MRFRLKGRRAWLIVAAVGVAAAGIVWMTRKGPAHEIPRPDLSAFAEREVQMELFSSARHVELNPRSAPAWGEYGIVLRAYGKHAEADRCFQVAADLDQADGRWPYLYGTHLADTDPSAAIPWLERAARGNIPDAARETVQARLGETLLAASRAADALAALEANPESPPRIRLVAARAAAAVGDDRTAAELIGDLVDHPLAARHALLLRSEICRRQGRSSYAALLAGRAADKPAGSWPDPLADPIRSRNRSRGGLMEEAGRLLRAGRPVEAEQLLRPLTADTTQTDPRAFVGLAEAREALGDRKGALAALAQAVKIDPKNVEGNYKIGQIHFDMGEQMWVTGRDDEARATFREAVAWLDKALAINPNFGRGLLLKGAALHRFLGKPDDGLALIRQFVQLRPEVGEGHFVLGQALAESGQRDAAVISLRRAVELAQPGDRRAVEALAKIDQSNRR